MYASVGGYLKICCVSVVATAVGAGGDVGAGASAGALPPAAFHLCAVHTPLLAVLTIALYGPRSKR